LAVGGLDALVGAIQLLANGRALGFRSGAGSMALSRSTDGFTLGAVFLLAIVLGAADTAGRTLAVYDALSTGSLFALHLALRTSTNRVANSRASGIIALPAAIRMALLSRNTDNSNKTKGCYNKSSHDYFIPCF
jgi:hypothetical protein